VSLCNSCPFSADRFLLLGSTIIIEPTPFGTAFLPLTADTFRFRRATSPEHLRQLHERIAEIERIRQEFGSCDPREPG